MGYTVSLPFGDNARYDMIVDDGENLHKIQVKSGVVRNGTIRFKVHRRSGVKRDRKSYTADEVDYFAVYCGELNETLLVPFEDAPKRHMNVRFEDFKERYDQNSIEDYRL
jgi:hypothetical protein